VALAELHHLIEKYGPRLKQERGSFHRTEREVQMPLLFYLPLIIWTGLLEVAHGKTWSLSKSRHDGKLDDDRTR
jgi:hypothetical protein